MTSCTVLRTKAYTQRPSPPIKAADCPNQVKRGNDGRMYESRLVPSGKSYRWYPQRTPVGAVAAQNAGASAVMKSHMRPKTRRVAVFHALGSLNHASFGLRNNSAYNLENAQAAVQNDSEFKVGDVVYVPETDYVSRQYHGLGLVLWDSRKKKKFLYMSDEGHINLEFQNRMYKRDVATMIAEVDYSVLLKKMTPSEFEALFEHSLFHLQMLTGFGTDRNAYRLFF